MRIDRIAFATALAKKDITCKRLAELSGVSRVTITGVKLAAVLGSEILKED